MPHPLPTLRLTWRSLGLSELAAHRLATLHPSMLSAPGADKVGG